MTLGEIKKPDIEAKLNYVINQVQYELARVKKMPDYVELNAVKGDLIRFENIADAIDWSTQ